MSELPWQAIHWLFVRLKFLKKTGQYFICGDEVVASNVGKEAYGLDRFFSSIQQRVVRTNLKASAKANVILFSTDLEQVAEPFRKQNPGFSILDLKSQYRGCRYAAETIKVLPEKPEGIY